jgi:two-component system, sensor histidine kinase and response regulator
MTPLLQTASLRKGGRRAAHSIMIVDDNPANLKLLEEILSRQGHEVRSFPRGRMALAAAAKNPPDLILLDINMPEMNGYEVCERLRSDAKLCSIPVIFLSALNETTDKVRAFQAGGVDYIAKPFQFEEVNARVETHLKLHNLQRALKVQNEHLEEAVAMRTRELAEANQRLTILDRSKNEFLGLISHEFRTPLNGLLGVGEIILADVADTFEGNELREMFDQSRQRILSILDDALLLTEIDVNVERFSSEPVSLAAMLRSAITRTDEFAKSRSVPVVTSSQEPCLVMGNEKLMARAFHALLDTAVKFSAVGETVRVSQRTGRDSVTLGIESRGKAVPESDLPKFFDLFAVSEVSTPGGDLGLGPPVAQRILSLFGASVSVSNQEPTGIRLAMSLKCA